jgi:protein-disulfide isomerase
MFSDFQCPFSKTAVTTLLPSVEAKYVKTGLVELAFRHLPLEVIHKSAVGAAVASECAGEQQSFWEMHDAIFLNQRQLDRASFERRVMRLGLNLAQYRTCVANPATDARVRLDVERAREFNITATPTFLVGIRGSGDSMIAAERLSGSLPIIRLERAIDSLVRNTKSDWRPSPSPPR